MDYVSTVVEKTSVAVLQTEKNIIILHRKHFCSMQIYDISLNHDFNFENAINTFLGGYILVHSFCEIIYSNV